MDQIVTIGDFINFVCVEDEMKTPTNEDHMKTPTDHGNRKINYWPLFSYPNVAFDP
jgi:hypothetical protein